MSSFMNRLVWILLGLVVATAFQSNPRFQIVPKLLFSRQTGLFAADNDIESLDEIRSMRVREIKEALTILKISSADAFEKEELVQRLYKARQDGPKLNSSQSSVPPNTIRGPLFFTSMDAGRQIASLNDSGLTINPSEQPYATIRMNLKNTSGPAFVLSLLLDTACSGLVLRPSVVKRYKLPSFSNPVTMTGAGGTTMSTIGLTQINRVEFGGEEFGPMPAAVQDIGALPSNLDGIIGLSFLGQFACVEMNFRNGTLSLYKKERRPPLPDNLEVIAEAEVSRTKLGIWTCDVMCDGRGPVKMLVDSGAANTFLNWKGVADLGLTSDSPLVQPSPVPTGAMGSDNIAMRLTHRLVVQQKLTLGRHASHPGLALSNRGLNVDIGDIAVLDTMEGDNVGGILGIDVLMRCPLVRMSFNGPVPRLTLMC